MKQKILSHTQLYQFFQELAVLLHAGIGLGDALALLAGDESGASAQLMNDMGRHVDAGGSLSSAMRESGAFPTLDIGMLEVGERSGRSEQALRALSRYHEQREEMSRALRSALTYPSILLMLMLLVILVLLTKVLPVFQEVYSSLGGQLSGVAGWLLALGQGLNSVLPLLCLLMAAAVALILAFSLSDSFRSRCVAFWLRRFGDSGLSRRMSSARFAQALAMGIGSGLPLEEAVDMCASLLEDIPAAARRCRLCARRLAEGGELAETLRELEMLPGYACRLLAAGMRGGSGDSVMDSLARRLDSEARQALERRVAQVEPALVLVCSLMVGAILLSVMLPLMNIMSAIG